MHKEIEHYHGLGIMNLYVKMQFWNLPKQSVCSKSKLGENPGGSEILGVNNLALANEVTS